MAFFFTIHPVKSSTRSELVSGFGVASDICSCKTNKTNVMKANSNIFSADSSRNAYFTNFKDCKRIQWSNHRNYGY